MGKSLERSNSRTYVICESPEKKKSFKLQKSESLPYHKKPAYEKSTKFLTSVEERGSRGSSGSNRKLIIQFVYILFNIYII